MLQKLAIAGKTDILIHLLTPVVDDPTFMLNKLMLSALSVEDIQELPEHSNKLSVAKQSPTLENISALHLASLNPNPEILKKLIKMLGDDQKAKNMQDYVGNTCIHYAAVCR